LRQGQLLTFDYGLTEEEWLAPHRPGGTLRAYHRHTLSPDPLAHPGEQDLTAHVNLTRLQRAGEEAGLRTAGLESQARFLTRVAEATWRSSALFPAWDPARRRQFRTLTHPEHLGTRFKVLLQSR
jgi:SAM-dependent MidA family methyltransferase